MDLTTPTLFPLAIALLLSVMSVSGCSGSSDPQSLADTESATADDANPADDENGESIADDDSAASIDGAGIDESTSVTADEPVDETSSTSESEFETPEPVEQVVLETPVDPVVPDPMVQNRTQVNFEIMVPVHQSDALQVRLIWGDIDTPASWVGDEFWSTSVDLPTNTEHALRITFYDNNGALELAGFEQTYHTGTNASETYTVTVDQFDANQFDTDEDGVSNLDEVIAGTDPSIDEDSLLEIRDFYELAGESRMSVSQSFEASLSEERPFFDTFESIDPDFPGTLSGNVDIDRNGNGTLTYNYEVYSNQLSLTGTRTHSDSSISWEGVRSAYDGDYRHIVNFNNTITAVDENTSHFVEEINGSNSGTYYFSWETSSNLTGNLVDGTSLCKPVAGMVSTTYRANRINSVTVTVTTVSKEIGDPYWRVVEVDNDTETTEYFVRELRILRTVGVVASTVVPEDVFFICDFVEF